MTPLDYLQEFVSVLAPAGQEERMVKVLAKYLDSYEVDGKGNLIVRLGKDDGSRPIVITAHMDEIAMIVTRVLPDGSLKVTSLGGLHPWKTGEGPVMIMASGGDLDAVLSFGSIHTNAASSPSVQAKNGPLTWEMAKVLTGLSPVELKAKGVRPGTRVVIHPNRRALHPVAGLTSGFFLDDRADLVSWLLTLQELRDIDANVVFVASAAEEVGGEGALYALHDLRPEVCIALELGANVPDAPVEITDQPTVWVTDGYATMRASDGDMLAKVGAKLGLNLQFQALSRGGSDASCAASHGLCARPITLGLAMENTHGFEMIHPNSMQNLANLTVALVRHLVA